VFHVTNEKGKTSTVIPLVDLNVTYTQSDLPGYLLNVVDVNNA